MTSPFLAFLPLFSCRAAGNEPRAAASSRGNYPAANRKPAEARMAASGREYAGDGTEAPNYAAESEAQRSPGGERGGQAGDRRRLPPPCPPVPAGHLHRCPLPSPAPSVEIFDPESHYVPKVHGMQYVAELWTCHGLGRCLQCGSPLCWGPLVCFPQRPGFTEKPTSLPRSLLPQFLPVMCIQR